MNPCERVLFYRNRLHELEARRRDDEILVQALKALIRESEWECQETQRQLR